MTPRLLFSMTCATVIKFSNRYLLPLTVLMAVKASATNNESHFIVGAGANYKPLYEGSKEYSYGPAPLISIQQGRFFANPKELGFNISTRELFQFGPIITYNNPRYEKDSSRLRGLGDVDLGLEMGGYASLQLLPFTLSTTFKHGLDGVTGKQIFLATQYGIKFGTTDELMFEIFADWADSKTMQAYFGVNDKQSAQSGKSVHTVASGLRSYGMGATWNHEFNQHWFSMIQLDAYRLGDTIIKSPIVDNPNGYSITALMLYRF